VHILGTIRGASHLPSSAPSVACHWRLTAGDKWDLVRGAASGATQAAAADFSRGGGRGGFAAALSLDGVFAARGAAAAAWEHPLDAHWSAGDVAGWPLLALTVWATDAAGRAELVGYGAARVPAAPGEHALEVACWRPEGSAAQEARAAAVGAGAPTLVDDATVHDPARAPRHALVTATTCVVHVDFAVVARGWEEQGVMLA